MVTHFSSVMVSLLPQLTLEVLEGNEVAQACYRKHGFEG